MLVKKKMLREIKTLAGKMQTEKAGNNLKANLYYTNN